MPSDKRRDALRTFKFGIPPYSYAPLRSAILGIFNVQVPMFGARERMPWEQIEAGIARATRKEDARAANLAVAKSLYDFAEQHGIAGREQDFFPMAMGTAAKIKYWSSAVIAVDGVPTVGFVDPRKRNALTAEARRFVFSVMHERIRVLNPDYADVQLGIIQFRKQEEGRSAVLFKDNGLDLFDFETLDRMVRETYEVWWQVQEEREAASKKGTGTWGPLFGE